MINDKYQIARERTMAISPWSLPKAHRICCIFSTSLRWTVVDQQSLVVLRQTSMTCSDGSELPFPEDPSCLAAIYRSVFSHTTWQHTSTNICFPDKWGMYTKCWPIVRTQHNMRHQSMLATPMCTSPLLSYEMYRHLTIAQNCRPMFPSSPVHLSSEFSSLLQSVATKQTVVVFTICVWFFLD